MKYNIPSLVCPHIIKARIWDSFLNRVENYGHVDNWLRCDSLSGILCRLIILL